MYNIYNDIIAAALMRKKSSYDNLHKEPAQKLDETELYLRALKQAKLDRINQVVPKNRKNPLNWRFWKGKSKPSLENGSISGKISCVPRGQSHISS